MQLLHNRADDLFQHAECAVVPRGKRMGNARSLLLLLMARTGAARTLALNAHAPRHQPEVASVALQALA